MRKLHFKHVVRFNEVFKSEENREIIMDFNKSIFNGLSKYQGLVLVDDVREALIFKMDKDTGPNSLTSLHCAHDLFGNRIVSQEGKRLVGFLPSNIGTVVCVSDCEEVELENLHFYKTNYEVFGITLEGDEVITERVDLARIMSNSNIYDTWIATSLNGLEHLYVGGHNGI